MILQEYQVKRLFNRYKIPTPPGQLVSTTAEATIVARQLNQPIILKAQTFSPHPMADGYYRVAETAHEASVLADFLFEATYDGVQVTTLLIEPLVQMQAPYYIAFQIDESAGQLVLQVAEIDVFQPYDQPQSEILSFHLKPFMGLREYHIWEIVDFLGISRRHFGGFADILQSLYAMVLDLGVVSLICYPIMLVDNSTWIIGDAQLQIDPIQGHDYPEIREYEDANLQTDMAKQAADIPADYYEFGGNVACVVNGMGNQMMLLDSLTDEGISPSSVTCIRGELTSDKVSKAVKLACGDSNADVVCINLLSMIGEGDALTGAVVDLLTEEASTAPTIARITTPKTDSVPRIPEGVDLTFSGTLPDLVATLDVVLERNEVEG